MSPIQPGDLSGYEINYGNDPNSQGGSLLIPNPGITSAEITDLASGTYYVSICSLDATSSCGIPTQYCSGSRSNTLSVVVP